MPRVRRAAAAVAVAALALGGCSGGSSPFDSRVRDGGAQVGTRAIETIAAADRSTTITLSGTTLEGKPLDTSRYRGKVVVINTWGSWCPPCNREAPALAKVSRALAKDGVQFVGVDLNESAATGRAFQRKYRIPYPSFANGDTLAPQLKGKAPTPPTTLVLDRQGRLAARAIVAVDETTLTGMVQDVLAERA